MNSKNLKRAKEIEIRIRYIEYDIKRWETICKGDFPNCVFVSKGTFEIFKSSAILDLKDMIMSLNKELSGL